MKWTTVLVALLLAGCATPQNTVVERQAAVEQQVGSVGSEQRAYVEAVQMARIERWKDDTQKIVNVYLFNPSTGNLLIAPVRCIGTPVSTTEDLEPGVAGAPGSTYSEFSLQLEGGETIRTNEVAGRDTTYGDEVPAWECLTVDGQYMRWGQFVPHIVSSAAYTFPPSTVQRDLATEVLLEQARAIIQRGGCVNPETLQEQECIR